MENEKRNILQNLFNKFHKNELTGDEIDDFLKIIKDDSDGSSLDKYYTEIWDSSSKLHSDAKSNLLYSNIEKTISEAHIELEGETKKIAINRKPLFSLLKYAAIFIIAFTTAWVGRKVIFEKKVFEKYNEENIVEVLYGSKSQIQLPDGSTVNLNSGSRLTYPTSFQNGKRDVYLTGEAFFQVEADEESPFFVHTSDLTIKVTGTKFNVKSYPGSKSIETTLVTGKLQIFDKKNGDEAWAFLSPNETAVYNKGIPEDELNETDRDELTPIARKKIHVKKEANTSETYAWKDNQLVFNNEKFKDLAIVLERWYNVKIKIQNENLINERFTGKFDTETIEQALSALQLIVPFKYEIDKNNILIYNTN